MNYIKGLCKTNLDDYDCHIVTLFVAVPRIGDKVTVSKAGRKVSLNVVSITHTVNENPCMGYEEGEPYIIVELNN